MRLLMRYDSFAPGLTRDCTLRQDRCTVGQSPCIQVPEAACSSFRELREGRRARVASADVRESAAGGGRSTSVVSARRKFLSSGSSRRRSSAPRAAVFCESGSMTIQARSSYLVGSDSTADVRYQEVELAAQAFQEIPAVDRPFVIRRSWDGERWTARIIARTRAMGREYDSVWLKVVPPPSLDAAFSTAYAALQKREDPRSDRT